MFLFHARGSLLEVETQVLLAHRLKYISEEEMDRLMKLTALVGRSLTGLINSLRSSAMLVSN